MRTLRHAPCWIAAALLAVCLAANAHADIIILKNGRRIVADNVQRANGKVSGETSAGVISVPESIVERIEKGATAMGADAASNPAAANLAMAPPVAGIPTDAGQIARLVVHDGVVDRDALASLDAAAGGGAAGTAGRAAAAETVASQFEFGRGNLEEALAHAERALALDPGQAGLLLNTAYLHLRRSENTLALTDLERARRIAPDSPDVAKLTGWADYGLNRLPQAVAEWKRAQELRPDAEVAEALGKAERDLATEISFREGESAHFVVRYYGGAAPDLARAILRLLEDDFDAIASTLDYVPPEPIGVVLYTNQAFADITRAPSWVGAINDGRIRIPVQGLETVTPELAHVLKHELTHSFVAQKTQGHGPVWLQEGVAQWMEGQRAGSAAGTLVALYDRHEDPSLAVLEGSWMHLPGDFAGIAYAWSLATVEGIVDSGGAGDMERLLDRVATEPSTEAALRSALRMDYSELNRSTAEYLRRTYLH